MCVVLLHLSEHFSAAILLPHAYLAVDFFFLLSGFVIAYAYDDRIARGMSLTTFMGLRLRRLYPLIAAGAVAGAVYAVALHLVEPDKARSTGYLAVALAFGLLLLPLSLASGDAPAYPLNGPSWSLLFELLSNFIYAFIGRRLSRVVLTILIAASAIGLVAISCLSLWNEQPGEPILHWTPLARFGLAGFSRVGFSFFSGVALFRLRDHKWISRVKQLPPVAAGTILVGIFAAPERWSNAYDLVMTLIAFPLIVLAASKAEPMGWTAVASIWSGWLSYPLYALHVPVALLTVGTLKYFHLYEELPKPWLGLAITSIVIATVFAFGKLYDEPLRRWLGATIRSPSQAARENG